MPKTEDVVKVLADRLTDDQIGPCSPSADDETMCVTHGDDTLSPDSPCATWLRERNRNTESVTILVEDEAVKDILMEYWDV